MGTRMVAGRSLRCVMTLLAVVATGFVPSSTQVNAIRSRDTKVHVILEPERPGAA